jgi:DNA-binding NarL/FixJ family response regulator
MDLEAQLRRRAPEGAKPDQHPAPRLLIADDHAIFAETLRDYLQKNFSVVGLVGDGRALVDEALRLRPDVVIVDVGMPLLNGMDAARRIKEQLPNMKFVFLTMLNDPNLAAAAVRLGTVAFVLKHSGGPELGKAIAHVLQGKPYLTPRLRADDWVSAEARARQYSQELTQRQREVVQLFAEGRSMKEISAILNLSPRTVEFHKHRIMESFNLKSNAQLVLFALEQGLIHANLQGS